MNITAPDVDISKTTSDAHGQRRGHRQLYGHGRQRGDWHATGVSFSDSLPAGLGTDIVWTIGTQDAANDFSISGTRRAARACCSARPP